MATASHVGQGQQPYQLTAAEIVEKFRSHPDFGLTSADALERLKTYGPNRLPSQPEAPAWLLFLGQFRDVQVYLLLFAAIVSLAAWWMEGAEGIPYEAITILAIVLLNATFGFFQEQRAGRALAALRSITPVESNVIRDGEAHRLLVDDLVPGDLLLLREGDRVPADARLLEVTAFHTQEAALTGESAPVLKSVDALPPGTGVADRANMVMAGTIAASGHAKALVVATGANTEFGHVAQLLRDTEERETPLQRDLDHLGKRLGLAILGIAAVVVTTILVMNGVDNRHLLVRALVFGVALAVAATPEGLAAVVTVVLAIGVQKMARRGAIVRHLSAVETLGEVTVIASDKTGTMTLNEMTVSTIVTASGRATSNPGLPGFSWDIAGDTASSEVVRDELNMLLKAAALANNASIHRTGDRWKMQGNPTEAALLVAAAGFGIEVATLEELYPRRAEIPFSSQRKRMSTLHHCPANEPLWGDAVFITKGAADLLLQRCTHEAVGGSARMLTDSRREEILKTHDAMAGKALRTLGVAFRSVPQRMVTAGLADERMEEEMTFLGLVGMIDPPRPEAREAVARASAAGIRSLLITGDHAATALAIANDLGMATSAGAITGQELEAMTEESLASALREVSVFARVSPQHKLQIIRALQSNGEIVAMTGDGVNDAPALKAADIGIAMGITGTDVAKEAADLVLTDDNFATIVTAIEGGRVIFDNIRKFLRYLLTTNFGEILTLFFGVIVARSFSHHGGELVLPLLAVQILWVNLVTDGAPAIALGMDPPSLDIMARAPFRAGGKIVDRVMILDIAVVAAIMAAGTLWIFLSGPSGESMALRRSLAFTTLILFQLFNAFEARSSSASGGVQLFRNYWLWGTVVLTIALQFILLEFSPLARAFSVIPLTAVQWLRCVLVASSVIWAMEILKALRRTLSQSGNSEQGSPGKADHNG